jgi:hypothetical protein
VSRVVRHMLTASDPLVEALISEGVVPKECREVDLIARASAVLELRYTIFVTDLDLDKLGRAFALAAQIQRDREAAHARDTRTTG